MRVRHVMRAILKMMRLWISNQCNCFRQSVLLRMGLVTVTLVISSSDPCSREEQLEPVTDSDKDLDQSQKRKISTQLVKRHQKTVIDFKK